MLSAASTASGSPGKRAETGHAVRHREDAVVGAAQLDGVLTIVVHEHVDAVCAQGHLEEGPHEAVTGLNQREGGLRHIVEATQALVLEVLDLGQEPVVSGA